MRIPTNAANIIFVTKSGVNGSNETIKIIVKTPAINANNIAL